VKYKEPRAMHEIHAIRIELYERWKSMDREEITSQIIRSSQEFLKKERLTHLRKPEKQIASKPRPLP